MCGGKGTTCREEFSLSSSIRDTGIKLRSTASSLTHWAVKPAPSLSWTLISSSGFCASVNIWMMLGVMLRVLWHSRFCPMHCHQCQPAVYSHKITKIKQLNRENNLFGSQFQRLESGTTRSFAYALWWNSTLLGKEWGRAQFLSWHPRSSDRNKEERDGSQNHLQEQASSSDLTPSGSHVPKVVASQNTTHWKSYSHPWAIGVPPKQQHAPQCKLTRSTLGSISRKG